MSAVPHLPSEEQDVIDLLMSEHREVESLLDKIAQTEQQPNPRDIAN